MTPGTFQLNLQLLNRRHHWADEAGILEKQQEGYKLTYKNEGKKIRLNPKGGAQWNRKADTSLTALQEEVYPPKRNNQNQSFQQRNTPNHFHSKALPNSQTTEYHDLPAQRKAVEYLMGQYLSDTVFTLTQSPSQIDQIASQLKANLDRFGYQPLHIDAFSQVRDTSHLINILNDLSGSKSHHRFELAASLILQFAQTQQTGW